MPATPPPSPHNPSERHPKEEDPNKLGPDKLGPDTLGPDTLGAEDLTYLAATEKLLLAVDFDGTLAEFSDSPTDVRAVPGALEALQELAGLPGVTVLIISGRQLRELSAVTGLPVLDSPGPDDIRLVGSHGAEDSLSGSAAAANEAVGSAAVGTADGSVNPTPSARAEVLQKLGEHAEQIAATDRGMWVEYKPYSVGLHTRQAASPEAAQQANQRLAEFTATCSTPAVPVQVTWGRDILELSVATATKGSYVAGLRTQLPEHVVFFLGDDVTDETVLASLTQPRPDVGVHVGGRLADTTAATRSLGSPFNVRDTLQQLAELRR
ncbi:trehalose-phosphatase [Corynebacterium urealyticum]|uniref:trehalose-phosphatase n=1 Tax=Corynebacterium urealyticum TaxID=43771 RepID=UPI0011E7A23A|nr:trehalose-phosphatase [Corynebacterium urealyticum]TYR16554.1 trehalose-phosphatase [Corynebacterium urealyticum]TYR17586.1 trehalose-phosphatase [Corynebacterium urealyticum]TYT20560.1 trehalose-phosphatase [Corynebacterium urealyticum]